MRGASPTTRRLTVLRVLGRRVSHVAACLVLATARATATEPAAAPADLVLTGGDVYTVDAAYAACNERETGSLEAGKSADLIVLDRNLFTIPPHEISEARVLLTLFAGREVHRDPALPAR